VALFGLSLGACSASPSRPAATTAERAACSGVSRPPTDPETLLHETVANDPGWVTNLERSGDPSLASIAHQWEEAVKGSGPSVNDLLARAWAECVKLGLTRHP